MKLTHGCIFTANIDRLREFYKAVLQIEPENYGDNYVEFPTEGATVSLFSVEAQEKVAPGSAQAASNRSLELEFLVADVDADYERLQRMEIEWVKPLTTQSWSRSFYFRDPDGNLINFYSPASSS